MLKVMWDHRCELKERLDAFEAESSQAAQNKEGCSFEHPSFI
jgi:hypothetical protein